MFVVNSLLLLVAIVSHGCSRRGPAKRLAGESTGDRRNLSRMPKLGDELSTEIGHVKINAVIGQGAFGKVFEGFWMEGKRKVAVKVEEIPDPEILEKFKSVAENEFEVLKAMNNTIGFPKVFAGQVEGDFKYLVMEFVGVDLMKIIERNGGQFPIEFFVNFVTQLIARIQSLHAKGFVMNDLHPTNICLDTSNKIVYMIDLGLAAPYIIDGVHVGVELRLSRRTELDEVLRFILRSYDIRIGCYYRDLRGGPAAWLIPAFEYLSSLAFDQEPDYDGFKRLILDNFVVPDEH